MKLLLFIILCLVWQVYADSLSTENSLPRKRRHSGADFVYPYFDVSFGGVITNSNYRQKSKYNYYYDSEKGEMVYDENLYYDIVSFDGKGLDLDFKAGVVLYRGFLPITLATFLDFGLLKVRGRKDFKYYSTDEETHHKNETRYYPSFLVGIVVYPVKLESSVFRGIFVSAAAGPCFHHPEYTTIDGNGSDGEPIVKLELGNVWSVREHYSVGIVGKAVWSFDNDDSEHEGDSSISGKTFGLALKIVRK